jgi:hypothetical protein
MTRTYHRRWHTGHGRFYARLKDSGFEGSAARLFDVPAHLYKQTGAAILGWLKSMVRGRLDESFEYETRIHFFLGFFRERRQECKRGALTELGDFARSLIWSRLHPGVARRR